MVVDTYWYGSRPSSNDNLGFSWHHVSGRNIVVSKILELGLGGWLDKLVGEKMP